MSPKAKREATVTNDGGIEGGVSLAKLINGVVSSLMVLGIISMTLGRGGAAPEQQSVFPSCHGEDVVAVSGYGPLASGATSEEALSNFLEATYPSEDEGDYDEDDQGQDGDGSASHKTFSKNNRRAVAILETGGETKFVEAFAICADDLPEDGDQQ
jgi:hypothetical protein